MGTTSKISIHALAKRATATVGKNIMPRLFQSTPSQRGRRNEHRQLFSCNISIHALAKRATVARKILPSDRRLFQSTPSQRGRRKDENAPLHNEFISIHALAKRATSERKSRGNRLRYFNPRPRKEGDSM